VPAPRFPPPPMPAGSAAMGRCWHATPAGSREALKCCSVNVGAEAMWRLCGRLRQAAHAVLDMMRRLSAKQELLWSNCGRLQRDVTSSSHLEVGTNIRGKLHSDSGRTQPDCTSQRHQQGRL
jgi:hypothetical protein